jgi:signal transduction histidine kinase
MGFGEILYKNFESFSEDEKKQYIKIIYESSVNLYRLLENLLHWSKSQLGTMNIKPELIPVQPIVNNEIQTLDLLIQKKGLKLNSRIDINTMVYADKNSVSIIVRNLLGNAIKFTQENGKISITANEMNSGVEISVTDSGVGMDQSDIDNLFSLTAAFSTQGTDNEEGTGLGLLLCKDLAEKNEGSIKVHSVKGVGSTFTITLPTNRWS